MSRAIGVRVGLSPNLTHFVFFSCLTSLGLKQPISKTVRQANSWKSINSGVTTVGFFLSPCLWAGFTLCPTNPPVLQATWPVKVHVLCQIFLQKGNSWETLKSKPNKPTPNLFTNSDRGYILAVKDWSKFSLTMLSRLTAGHKAYEGLFFFHIFIKPLFLIADASCSHTAACFHLFCYSSPFRICQTKLKNSA